jgi:hypothetical protein
MQGGCGFHLGSSTKIAGLLLHRVDVQIGDENVSGPNALGLGGVTRLHCTYPESRLTPDRG